MYHEHGVRDMICVPPQGHCVRDMICVPPQDHCVRDMICVPPQGHCVAALMALLELMSPRHYQMIRQTFAKASDLEVSTH